MSQQYEEIHKSFIKNKESAWDWLKKNNKNKNFDLIFEENKDNRKDFIDGIAFNVKAPLLVTVIGDVKLIDIEWLPIKFKEVKGNFQIEDSKINPYCLPQEIFGNFRMNLLNGFQHLPKNIHGHCFLSFYGSNVKSFLYAPESIEGKFYIEGIEKIENFQSLKEKSQQNFLIFSKELQYFKEKNNFIDIKEHVFTIHVIQHMIQENDLKINDISQLKIDWSYFLKNLDWNDYEWIKKNLDKIFLKEKFQQYIEKHEDIKNSTFFYDHTRNLKDFNLLSLEKIIHKKMQFSEYHKDSNDYAFKSEFSFLSHKDMYDQEKLELVLKKMYDTGDLHLKKKLERYFYEYFPKEQTIIDSFNENNFYLPLLEKYCDIFNYEDVFNVFIENYKNKYEFNSSINDHVFNNVLYRMVEHNKKSDKVFFDLKKYPEGPIWYYHDKIKEIFKKCHLSNHAFFELENLFKIMPISIQLIKKDNAYYDKNFKKTKFNHFFLQFPYFRKTTFSFNDKNVKKNIVQTVKKEEIKNFQENNFFNKFQNELDFFQSVKNKVKPLEKFMSYEEKFFFEKSFEKNFNEILDSFKFDVKNNQLSTLIKIETMNYEKYDNLLKLMHQQIIINAASIVETVKKNTQNQVDVNTIFLEDKINKKSFEI